MTVRRGRCYGTVRFAPAVVLTKREAFEACEVCAEVERALLRAGRAVEAARAAALFELFESRLLIDGGARL
jgi:hypothetical protein